MIQKGENPEWKEGRVGNAENRGNEKSPLRPFCLYNYGLNEDWHLFQHAYKLHVAFEQLVDHRGNIAFFPLRQFFNKRIGFFIQIHRNV